MNCDIIPFVVFDNLKKVVNKILTNCVYNNLISKELDLLLKDGSTLPLFIFFQQNLLKGIYNNLYFRYLSISRPLSSINTSKQRRRAKYIFLSQFSQLTLILFIFQTDGGAGLAGDPGILLAPGSHIQSVEASQERILSMHYF